MPTMQHNPWARVLEELQPLKAPDTAAEPPNPGTRICNEKSLQWEACAPQPQGSPLLPQLEKNPPQQQRSSTAKNK